MYAIQTDLRFISQQHVTLGNYSDSVSSAVKWREGLSYRVVGGLNKVRMNMVPDTVQAFSNVPPFALGGN